MSAYCFSIRGVRLFAIHGANMDWKGRGMRSPSEKRFLRKSWVSETWMLIGETIGMGMECHIDKSYRGWATHVEHHDCYTHKHMRRSKKKSGKTDRPVGLRDVRSKSRNAETHTSFPWTSSGESHMSERRHARTWKTSWRLQDELNLTVSSFA
jgi:hypothetical protein